MVPAPELLEAVEAEHARTGQAFPPWPDPHPDRAPLEEEYSRCLDPAKWGIVGARADAWLEVLARSGAAVIERDADVVWEKPPRAEITRVDVARPRAPRALPLVIARTPVDDLDGAAVVIGAGDPVALVDLVPGCGCDACDSGSQRELDELDARILGIVSGELRRLTRGSKVLTVLGGGVMSGVGDIDDFDAVLADPRGWVELSGPSWFDHPAV